MFASRSLPTFSVRLNPATSQTQLQSQVLPKHLYLRPFIKMHFYVNIILIVALASLANTAPVANYDETYALLARSYADDNRDAALNAVRPVGAALNAVRPASEKRAAALNAVKPALNAVKPALNAVHALNAVQPAAEKREATPALNAVWPKFPIKPASEKRKVALNAVAAINAVKPDSEKRH
jgi:hypothetical protein